MRRHREALQADFARFYGIHDVVGGVHRGRVSPLYAADLAVALPRESLTFQAENPDSMSDELAVLEIIEYDLACLIYGLAGGRKSGKPAPRPIWKQHKAGTIETGGEVFEAQRMTIDALRDLLKISDNPSQDEEVEQ